MKALQKSIEKYIAASQALRLKVEAVAKTIAPFETDGGNRRLISLAEATTRAESEAHCLLAKIKETV